MEYGPSFMHACGPIGRGRSRLPEEEPQLVWPAANGSLTIATVDTSPQRTSHASTSRGPDGQDLMMIVLSALGAMHDRGTNGPGKKFPPSICTLEDRRPSERGAARQSIADSGR